MSRMVEVIFRLPRVGLVGYLPCCPTKSGSAGSYSHSSISILSKCSLPPKDILAADTSVETGLNWEIQASDVGTSKP